MLSSEVRLGSEDVETPLATAGHGEATVEKCESLFMASRTISHLNPNFAQILCSLTQLVAPEATLCNEMCGGAASCYGLAWEFQTFH